MAQISRPYQIAFVAIVGLVLVWFVALRHHGEGSSGSSAPSSSAVAKPAAQTSAATPTPIYKGAAPGVEGLTRAVRKAHEAVGVSQQNAKTLAAKSAQASGEQPASAQTSSSVSSRSAAQTARQGSPSPAKGNAPAMHASKGGTGAANQVTRELAQGKTVLLLFWNSKSVYDRAVRKQLRVAGHMLGRKVVVHEASASQIGMFGQVTQDVPVSQTPTILLITPKRLVTPIVGFTDAFSIRQAVKEAS